MTISIKFKFEDEILHVTASGDYTLKSAKDTMYEMINVAQKENVDKILVDCRPISNFDMPTMDVFDYSTTIAKNLFDQNYHPRLAYIFTTKYLDSIKQFGENVAVNRGVTVQLFDDIGTAVSWLNED